jgi:hypothetical protein
MLLTVSSPIDIRQSPHGTNIRATGLAQEARVLRVKKSTRGMSAVAALCLPTVTQRGRRLACAANAAVRVAQIGGSHSRVCSYAPHRRQRPGTAKGLLLSRPQRELSAVEACPYGREQSIRPVLSSCCTGGATAHSMDRAVRAADNS